MKKAIALLLTLMVSPLIFAVQSSGFNLNAYKMNPSTGDDLNYSVLFTNLYSGGDREGTPIAEDDVIPYDVSTLSSKPSDGGYYTELFQISIAVDKLTPVSIRIDGPETFHVPSSQADENDGNEISTNHMVEKQYYYYSYPQKAPSFTDTMVYGTNAADVTCSNIFGEDNEYLDGGWVECRITVSLAIDRPSEIDRLQSLVAAGTAVELPYSITVEISGD